MSKLSLRQFLIRRAADPTAGIRHMFPRCAAGSLRYLLTSATFAKNLVNGDEVLPRLIQDISLARREINLSIYLFFNDSIGSELADLLIDKASNSQNPVRVRVILNIGSTKIGHITDLEIDKTYSMVKKLCDGGVEVLNSSIDYQKEIQTTDESYSANAKDIRETIKADDIVVDHRKLITIDGTIAYCGSANIGEEYLYRIPFNPAKDAKSEADEAKKANRPEAWEKWHDGLVRFAGPIVPKLDEVFRERWVLDGGQDYQCTLYDPCHYAALDGYALDDFRIVSSQPNGKTNTVLTLFAQMIAEAKHSIFIQNPYLYHPGIVNRLIAAKRKNQSLRVDLILPDQSQDDSLTCYDAQQFRYQLFLPEGINVYEYKNHFNHLKLACFDEQYSIVGSTNLNYRSLENDRDFELVILVDSQKFATDLIDRVRNVDITRSRRFNINDVVGVGSGLWSVNCRDPATVSGEALREI